MLALTLACCWLNLPGKLCVLQEGCVNYTCSHAYYRIIHPMLRTGLLSMQQSATVAASATQVKQRCELQEGL